MDETRIYHYFSEETNPRLELKTEIKSNPYVESSIKSTLLVIKELGGRLDSNIEICIYGDNAFYSIPESGNGEASNQRFAKIIQNTVGSDNSGPAEKQLQQQHAAHVQKTGLGSSAALVTAVVGALLAHFGAVSVPKAEGYGGTSAREPLFRGSAEDSLTLLHNLAQMCHCAAQVLVITPSTTHSTPLLRCRNPSRRCERRRKRPLSTS